MLNFENIATVYTNLSQIEEIFFCPQVPDASLKVLADVMKAIKTLHEADPLASEKAEATDYIEQHIEDLTKISVLLAKEEIGHQFTLFITALLLEKAAAEFMEKVAQMKPPVDAEEARKCVLYWAENGKIAIRFSQKKYLHAFKHSSGLGQSISLCYVGTSLAVYFPTYIAAAREIAVDLKTPLHTARFLEYFHFRPWQGVLRMYDQDDRLCFTHYPAKPLQNTRLFFNPNNPVISTPGASILINFSADGAVMTQRPLIPFGEKQPTYASRCDLLQTASPTKPLIRVLSREPSREEIEPAVGCSPV